MFKNRRKKIQSDAPCVHEEMDQFTRLSDEDFVELMYNKLLGRGSDEPGKRHYLDFLKKGNSRVAVVLGFTESPEFTNKILREKIHLIPIKDEKSDQYSTGVNRETQEQFWIFHVHGAQDFDWLEKKIVENGYYERQGVWLMDIDEDKQLLSEMTLDFQPRTVLDFGCANGPILKCLQDKGVHAEGVEISSLAMDKAFPEVRSNIHLGDLRTLTFTSKFDVVLGLDIFEHLNPNKLDDYIIRIHDILEHQGLVFCNIPGFGRDPIFGEIHKVYLDEWDEDMENNKLFHSLHVDNYGYPKNGHIIHAGTHWWVEQFEKNGFKRETEIETALHKKYDERITQVSLARKSIYLFSKNASDNLREDWLSNLGE